MSTLASNLPAYILRNSVLPLEEVNQTYKCQRCWHCCVTADPNINWMQFNKDFELPIKWIKTGAVTICPFLTADDGTPSCLIYDMRPEMCRATFCKWMNHL